MKQQFVILLLALLSALPASSQQALVTKRSQTPLLYPEFREAKILQPFGRFVTAKANIFLKDGSLVYLDDKTGKVMRAYVSNIIGVNFGDSVRYLKVDSVMARVVAEKNYNYLLCNTHVNMSLYREETDGTRGMDFFDMPDSGVFLNLDSQKRNDDTRIPLPDTYYISSKGTILPANESEFNKF